MSMETQWNDIGGITEEILRKTCHCSVLPITNPTWTELVANLSLHDEMPVTDCLIHGTA
jgi:hypothetical protein